MKYKFLLLLAILLATVTFGFAKAPVLYEIRIYHLQNRDQEARVDRYLKDALLPALQRSGIPKVGVFKPLVTDSLAGKRIYVLIPFRSAAEFARLPQRLGRDREHRVKGEDYLQAPADRAPYSRIETLLLEAFSHMPAPAVPKLNNEPSRRIYELRSYESPTEERFANKVHMFNEGGEVALFDRLGFNAVFYGSVLSGGRMPNLMYMTAHEDMDARERNWKAFGADPEWKRLSGMDFYKNNVSRINIVFLHPTEYSGF